MIVKDFSKGINLVKAPDKLDPGFAVRLENVDNFGGDIKSTKHPGDVKTSLHEPYFYQPKGLTEGFSIFTASRASYWAFKNGVAYQADGISKPQKWYNRGLVGAGAVGAVALSPGNYDHTNLEHQNLGIERPDIKKNTLVNNSRDLTITENFSTPPRADVHFEPYWNASGILEKTYPSHRDFIYIALHNATGFTSGIPNQGSFTFAIVQHFTHAGTKYIVGVQEKTITDVPATINNVNVNLGVKLGAGVGSDLSYDIYLKYTLANNTVRWHKLYSNINKSNYESVANTRKYNLIKWHLFGAVVNHSTRYDLAQFIEGGSLYSVRDSYNLANPHPGQTPGQQLDANTNLVVVYRATQPSANIRATLTLFHKLSYGNTGSGTFIGFAQGNQQEIQPTSSFLTSVRVSTLPTLDSLSGITDNVKINYQLFVTYYDDEFGIESRQSDLGPIINVYPHWNYTIGNLPTSADPQVTHKRIYAVDYSTGATKLLGEIANTSTSINVFFGGTFDDVFTGENNEPAPEALLYITQNFGTLFGSVGNELRWCIPGHYDYWPPSNSISFEKPITGILPFNQGLLVFTEDETWGVLGSSIENFTKVPISFDQGCINNDTCKFIKSLPIWMSKEGLCTFYSGQVQVLSRALLGSTHIYTNSCALYNERYFILGLNEIWEFDFRMGVENLSIKHHSIPTDITPLQLGVIDDKLVYSYTDSSNNHWYKELISERGTENTLVYKSPIFTEGSFSILKQLNEINFKLEGTFSIVVTQYHESGTFAQTQAVTPTDKFYKFKLDSQNQNFLGFDIEITGTGVISEFGYNPIPNQLVERVPPRV